MDVSRQLRALNGIRLEPFEKNLENPANGENEHYRTIFFVPQLKGLIFLLRTRKIQVSAIIHTLLYSIFVK